jgi:hypothetical protein
VLWPRTRFFAVLNQAGLPVTLPYLAELTERWRTSREDRRSPLWEQAHDLSRHMVYAWPTEAWYPRNGKAPSEAAHMLTVLTQLADTPRIEALLAKIAARGGYDRQDNGAILDALAILPPDARAGAVVRLIRQTAAMSLSACGELLERAVATYADGRKTDFVGAAADLLEALPGDPAGPTVVDAWRRKPGVEAGLIVDLLTALGQIDEALAGRAADVILAWPQTYDLDAVLIPAIRELVVVGDDGPAVQRLRAICLDHLRIRIAQPLEAPKDWRRTSVLSCSCGRCAELGQFLADPQRRIWTFKAAEAERAHVRGTAMRARCDLDLTIDKRGRPYSLVCTKNQASYDRRANQRKQDLEDLARLDH